jgi:hypothetical protein
VCLEGKKKKEEKMGKKLWPLVSCVPFSGFLLSARWQYRKKLQQGTVRLMRYSLKEENNKQK